MFAHLQLSSADMAHSHSQDINPQDLDLNLNDVFGERFAAAARAASRGMYRRCVLSSDVLC